MKKLIGTAVAMAAVFAYAVSIEAKAMPAADTTGVDVPAGPIFSNDDAQRICPAVCTAAGGRWNGNWRTVIPGKSSVCGCD